ncbi:MAG: serine/threonine protein kinase [Planctomycetes bacterium]|nr:serine/threonine protein kinase [Planctomycetota bacterium]
MSAARDLRASHGASERIDVALEEFLCAREAGSGVGSAQDFLDQRGIERGSAEARTFEERLASYERLERSLARIESSPSIPSLAAGTHLGRYRIAGLIGRGGMGEVYQARDERLRRDVALKLISPERARDPRMRRRFEREARSAGALAHPHLVTVFDLEEEDGRLFLVMELVAGHTLRDLPAEEQPAPVRRVEILAAVARAMAVAHRAGIVHRDLKPENLMLTPEGEPKVLDFGLAKPLDPESVGATSHTGQMLGTTAYMSPEQVRGRELTAASDQFSLAVVLFEWLSGRRPFEGASTFETAEAIVKHAPRRLELAEPYAAEIESVLLRALEKVPERRYPDLDAFADDLERALGGRPARGGRAPRADAASWRRAVLGTALVALALVLLKLGLDALRPDAAKATRDIPALAVLPCLRGPAPDDGDAGCSDFVESAVVKELERTAAKHGLRIVEPELLRAIQTRGDRLEHAYQLGAVLAIEPSLRCRGEHLVVELSLIELAGERETFSRASSDEHELGDGAYATSGQAARQALKRLALEAPLARADS